VQFLLDTKSTIRCRLILRSNSRFVRLTGSALLHITFTHTQTPV